MQKEPFPMSREQRDLLDRKLREPHPEPEPDIAALRAWFEDLMSAFPVPAGVRSTATTLAGRDALLVEPEDAAAARPGTLLYFHGGSWVLGSPRTSLALTAGLVARTGLRAFSLDYRLAPEH